MKFKSASWNPRVTSSNPRVTDYKFTSKEFKSTNCEFKFTRFKNPEINENLSKQPDKLESRLVSVAYLILSKKTCKVWAEAISFSRIILKLAS